MNIRQLFIVFSLAGTRVSLGQSDAAATESKIPALNFQVIKRWKVEHGDHAIFFNRVAPPVLPAPPVEIQQNNVPISAAALGERLAAKKKSEVLFLTVTVHDHKFSVIRLMDNEHPWTAFSNVDFNLLGCTATFETADTVYFLLCAVVNAGKGDSAATDLSEEKSETLPRRVKQIPSLDQLGPTQAQYLVVEDDSGVAPEAHDLAALDALHIYFDANRQRLSDEFAKREATRLEQEQRPNQSPAKPKDTVINYWIGEGATRTLDKRGFGARP